jgi:hypothetical protein
MPTTAARALTARTGSQAYAAAPAPEAAAEGAPAMASPFKTPGRRALEEEIKMVADHTQGKAAGLDKWGKKVAQIQRAPRPRPLPPTPNLHQMTRLHMATPPPLPLPLPLPRALTPTLTR